MRRSPRSSSNRFAIQAGVGEGFLDLYFRGKSFIHCIVELLKNARDWGGTLIMIQTDLGNHLFRQVDNGLGMDQRNRNSFTSVNMTTAKGVRQSGLFGSGSKHMLFSFCSRVEVVTAPQSEPDQVFRFGFTTGEYEGLVLSGGVIEPEVVSKNEDSWPYDFRFGTEITYILRDPRSRSILRGDRLARELSIRLPMKFGDIIRVDGQALPPREVIGSFEMVEQHQALGSVAFELYNPARRHTDEELRFTAAEIGEVPVANLFRVLGDYRAQLPPIFLVPEVCGTISAPFLRDYSSEGRFTFSSELAGDPRTPHLLRILKNFAPEVQRRLRIQIKPGAAGDSDREDIEGVAALCNQTYNPKGEEPPGGTGSDHGDDISGIDEDECQDNQPNKPPISLFCRSEFEVGETIEVRARIRKDLGGSYTDADLEWNTRQSLSTNQKFAEGTVAMTALKTGHALVRVSLRGTPYSAEVRYAVVEKRVFRLSIPFAELEPGKELPIMAVNSDKLAGMVEWRLSGVGMIDPRGRLVTYRATMEGRAMVTGADSKNPSVSSSCEVTVVPALARILCIRNEYFTYETAQISGTLEFAKPANMIRGARTHRLIFNQLARGYQVALSSGILGRFLQHAIAMEFARFSLLELADRRLDEVDPRDFPGFLHNITSTGYEVLEELLRGTR